MHFDLGQVINVGIQILALFGTVGGAYWALKSEVRLMKDNQLRLATEIGKLAAIIDGNGFLKRREADSLLKQSEETHKRIEEAIQDLEHRVRQIEVSRARRR